MSKMFHFKDFNKKPNIILTKDYNYGHKLSLDVKSKVDDGLKFSGNFKLDHTNIDNAPKLSALAKINYKKNNLDLEFIHKNKGGHDIKAEIDLENTLKGTKLVVNGYIDPTILEIKEKIGIRYTDTFTKLGLEVDLSKNKIAIGAVAAYKITDDFLFGVDFKFDPSKRRFTKYEGGFHWKQGKDFAFTLSHISPKVISVEYKLGIIRGMLLHRPNKMTSLAAQADYNWESKSSYLLLGLTHKLQKSCVAKVKVDSLSKLAASLRFKVNKNVSVIASTQSNLAVTSDPESKKSQYGFGVEMKF